MGYVFTKCLKSLLCWVSVRNNVHKKKVILCLKIIACLCYVEGELFGQSHDRLFNERHLTDFWEYYLGRPAHVIL